MPGLLLSLACAPAPVATEAVAGASARPGTPTPVGPTSEATATPTPSGDGAAAAPESPPFTAEPLAPGFEFGHYRLPTPSRLGPGQVDFLRLDPQHVNFEVRAASFSGGQLRPASGWATEEGSATAVGVINSSMFQGDWLRSVGFLEVHGRVQNARWAEQQNSLLVFDPVAKGRGARVLNLGCSNREEVSSQWGTAVQSIRMLGCDGAVVWAQSEREWSSAILGEDKEGRILFLHTRAPYSMHDLARMLVESPLHPVALHYAEGGPEASLYVRGPGVEEKLVGSYETGFRADDGNAEEWDLPNVVVARAR